MDQTPEAAEEYLARDTTTKRDVVLAIVDSTAAGDRIQALWASLGSYSNPRLARFLDLVAAPPLTVLVREFLPGSSLQTLTSRASSPPSASQILIWSLELARLLEALEDRNLDLSIAQLRLDDLILGPDGHLRAVVRRSPAEGNQAKEPEAEETTVEHDPRVLRFAALLSELATSEPVHPRPAWLARAPTASTHPDVLWLRTLATGTGDKPRLESITSLRVALERRLIQHLLSTRGVGVIAAVLAGLAAWSTSALLSPTSGMRMACGAGAVALGSLGTWMIRQHPQPRANAAGYLLLLSGGVAGTICLAPEQTAALSAWMRRFGLEIAPPLLELPVLAWVSLLLCFGIPARSAWLWWRGQPSSRLTCLTSLAVLLAGFLVFQEELQVRDTIPAISESGLSRVGWTLNTSATSRLEVALGRGGEVDPNLGFVVTDDLNLQVFDLTDGTPGWQRRLTDPMNLLFMPGEFIFLDGLTLESVDITTGSFRDRMVLDKPYQYVLPANPTTMVAAYSSDTLQQFRPGMTDLFPTRLAAILHHSSHWQAWEWPTGRLKWSKPNQGILRHAWAEDALIDYGRGRFSLIDLESGSTLWTLDAGPPTGTLRVLGAENLLLWYGGGDFKAFERTDGSLRYRIDNLLPSSALPVETHPSVLGARNLVRITAMPDLLVVGVNSRIAAFTPDKGLVLWSRNLGLEEIREILPGTPTITVQCHSGRLIGLSASTGEQVWEHWPRDRGGLALSHKELRQRRPRTFNFLDMILYQVPGIPRVVMLSPQTGQVIERLELAEGEKLTAATNMVGRLLLAVTNKDGGATIRSYSRPLRHQGGEDGTHLDTTQ